MPVLLGLALLVSACAGQNSTLGSPVTLTVSAASNLMPALEEIGANFTQETGVELVFNFGASTQLAQQILHGAPVDVFLSAGQAEIDLLLAENRLLEETVTPFARGTLVLWQPESAGEEITSLSALLQPGVRRIAIANPAYAPYGAAARQALQSQGLWDALADKIVYGSTASHALQMAETGGVDAALTALSLSLTAGGRWFAVPAGDYEPLVQVAAVVADTPHTAQAQAFVQALSAAFARQVWQSYGYELEENTR